MLQSSTKSNFVDKALILDPHFLKSVSNRHTYDTIIHILETPELVL